MSFNGLHLSRNFVLMKAGLHPTLNRFVSFRFKAEFTKFQVFEMRTALRNPLKCCGAPFDHNVSFFFFSIIKQADIDDDDGLR